MDTHMEQARPQPPRHHEQPYGREFFLLGLHAADALYHLCDVPSQTDSSWVQWVESDRFALSEWIGIEEDAFTAYGEAERSEVARADTEAHVGGLLLRYRLSLPFEEAEREWLYEAYAAADGDGPEIIKTIGEQEAEIMSAGRRRIVSGRDLLRRWWAWRREAEEYRGQGSLDVARETLRQLIETVSPDLELPEPYLALRRAQARDNTWTI